MSRILERPLTLADMLRAKAIFMSEHERQKSDKKCTKQDDFKRLGKKEDTGESPLDKS